MCRKPASKPAEDGDGVLPMPGRVLYGVIIFWHVVTVVVYLALGVGLIWSERAALGPKPLFVVALVAFQLGSYLRFYVFGRRYPFSARAHVIYFGGGLLAWFIEQRLYPQFSPLLFTFVGQSFGLLPPAGAISVLLFALAMVLGENTTGLGAGDVLGIVLGFGGMFAVYLFIHSSMRTSEQRGHLIRELEQTKHALEASREREAELAVLRDRERIARDMHDSLGHTLVALSVQLEATQRLYKVDPERASAQMERMKTLTRVSMTELRRTIAGLRAAGLEGRALSDRLAQFCVAVAERSQLDVRFKADPSTAALSADGADALWAVAQEALVNVERHARAHTVDVSLNLAGNCVELRVCDDGSGLAQGDLEKAGHYGVRGMRERLAALGGELTFDSAGGTRLTATVPLRVV